MIKANILDYFEDNSYRNKEGIVAIYYTVTPEEWTKFPALCNLFFQEFETGLLLYPMGDRKLDVWFLVEDTSLLPVTLEEAEEFVTHYLKFHTK